MVELEENRTLVRNLSKQLSMLQLALVVVTAVSSGMAAFKAQLWVPMTLALISLIEFVMAYQQLESRLPAANATIATLTGLLMKWDGLSLVQRRMPNSKELIVRTTEDAILLQHNSFVAGAANISGPGGDDDEDQHEDGDEENATKKKTK